VIIIGEKINTSIKNIQSAVAAQDAEIIKDIALKQAEAGADYIDVNCGTFVDKEPELLQWITETVQSVTDKPMCFDSPNPEALKRALEVNKNGKPLINSITAEKGRFNAILPLILEHGTSVVALCMDDNGMPETADERLKIAERLADDLMREGVKLEDIYFDPMIRPIGTGSHYGVVALETIKGINKEFPEAHTICGLSNISFGLPVRKLINQTFLVLAIGAGLSSAILDPLDNRLMSFVYTAELLMDKDPYCLYYIAAFRQGRLDA